MNDPIAQATTPKMESLRLKTPILRGEQEIKEIALRKPKAGELRGLSIQELMQARVSSTLDLLPRISMPPITQQEADNLEPEDVAIVSGIVIGFFITARDKIQIEQALNR